MKIITKISIIILLLNWTPLVSAYKSLTNTPARLYGRCYSHLTGELPKKDSPLYKQVMRNELPPIAACLKIIDQAKFSNTTQAQEDGTKVLQHIYRIYQSWSVHAGDPNSSGIYVDDSEFGLSWAWATFHNNGSIKAMLRGNKIMAAVRDLGPIAAPKKLKRTTDYFTGERIHQGALLQVKKTSGASFSVGNRNYFLRHSFGGGVLGNVSYFKKNTDLNSPSDGAVNMPRTWSRAIVEDFLCRQLPLLDESDVSRLVVSNAQAPFRKSANCTSCHATMDQMAGVVRHMYIKRTISDPLRLKQSKVVIYSPTILPRTKKWPANSDPNYSKRPTTGKLYFRSYDGQLIDQDLTDLDDLGRRLTETKDLYMCYVKRMYHHLFSIDVPMVGQQSDFNGNLKKHRQIVLDLADDLKKHQKPNRIIKKMLQLQHYSNSDSNFHGN